MVPDLRHEACPDHAALRSADEEDLPVTWTGGELQGIQAEVGYN